jgi:hypothetical protein
VNPETPEQARLRRIVEAQEARLAESARRRAEVELYYQSLRVPTEAEIEAAARQRREYCTEDDRWHAVEDDE